jgi:hypothetical protein
MPPTPVIRKAIYYWILSHSEGGADYYIPVDTDPGADDILAILLALASPEIEILAYVVTHGLTSPSSPAREARKKTKKINHILR